MDGRSLARAATPARLFFAYWAFTAFMIFAMVTSVSRGGSSWWFYVAILAGLVMFVTVGYVRNRSLRHTT